jgi:hypothetical protein
VFTTNFANAMTHLTTSPLPRLDAILDWNGLGHNTFGK